MLCSHFCLNFERSCKRILYLNLIFHTARNVYEVVPDLDRLCITISPEVKVKCVKTNVHIS